MFRFKQSIRFKIASIVIISTFITTIISWSLSNNLIERFYVSRTKNSLVNTYDSCNEFFSDVKNIRTLEREETLNLSGYIDNDLGASIYIINPKNLKVYFSGRFNERVAASLYEMIEEMDINHYKYSTEQFSIVKNNIQMKQTTSKNSGTYYDLMGLLDNEFVILIRTPIDTITSNSVFTARLFMTASLVLLLIELMVVFFITNIFASPIIEMSRVSKRMANMDFSTKVDVVTNDEIGELGKSMNDMSIKLESTITELKNKNLELSNDIRERDHIEEMRSEFLSHVSHELKTPLAIIQGYAEGIKAGIADDPDTMNYYCDVISDEASKMNALVMKLIDLNQLETGDDISIERFDITKLVQDVVNNTSILLQDKNVSIEFNVKEPLYVWADTFMTEEVLTNYLSNAIHHVKDPGIIKVWYEEREDGLRICVFNEGDPIADKDIDKLYIKFYKSDAARTRAYGGSGIGLSIVAAIMKAHNKDFGVYNAEDGVVFYFELDTHA